MRQIISYLIGLLLFLCYCQDSPEVGVLYKMHTRVTETSNSYITGYPFQTKIAKIEEGAFCRRIIMLCPGYENHNSIHIYWTDPPYDGWSGPVEVVDNSFKDYPFSFYVSPLGVVYLVWTKTGTYDLYFRKVWFTDKDNIATSSEVVIHEHATHRCYYPTITIDSIDRLWVSWTYYDSVADRNFVHVKWSVNDGATWGSGPSDSGTALTNGSKYCYSQVVFLSSYIWCIYSDGHLAVDGYNRLAHRRFALGGSVWDSQVVLREGVSINQEFCVKVNALGTLGILHRAGDSLEYRQYRGSFWDSTLVVDSGTGLKIPHSPFLEYYNDVPYAFWEKKSGNRQRRLFHSYQFGEEFSTPVVVAKSLDVFDKLYCYVPGASEEYWDVTASGAEDTAADVYHHETNVLVENEDDAILLGMTCPFAQATIELSTAGVGGEISWEYYGKSGWSAFVPENGTYHLEDTHKLIHFWKDVDSCPIDWVLQQVEGYTAYWVRGRVTSAFATPPVGTQITASVDLSNPQVILENREHELVCLVCYGVTRVTELSDLIMAFRDAIGESYVLYGFESRKYLDLCDGQTPEKFYFDSVHAVGNSDSLSDDLLVRISFDGGEHFTTCVHTSREIDIRKTVQAIPSGEWDPAKGVCVSVQVQSLASLRDLVPSAQVASEYIRGDVGKPGVEIDVLSSETSEKILIMISQRDGTFSGLVPPGNYDLKFRGLPVGQTVSMVVAGQPIKTQRDLVGVAIGHSDRFGKFGKTAGEVSKQVEEADIKDTFSGIEWARYLIFDTFVDASKKADPPLYIDELFIGEGKLYIGGTSIDWFLVACDPSL